MLLLVLSFSFVLGASAEEKIDGKCSITINPSIHTGDNDKRAKATGKCGKLVTGYYAGGNFHVTGGHDGTVVDGEKYNVLVMPGFYTYEVTVHAIRQNQSLVAPAVSSVGTSDKKVTGTTEPKVKVVVKSGKTTLGTSTADKNGKYTVSLKKSLKVGLSSL
ncbi:Ig-like domain-containing protein [Peribacillus psychrosaccharolyticus]|uniref:Ig-like domain-containing protein n=1 Tax=Peribacillus psychrosaccharolyticus TaxID=1407 RepID=UPI003D2D6171